MNNMSKLVNYFVKLAIHDKKLIYVQVRGITHDLMETPWFPTYNKIVHSLSTWVSVGVVNTGDSLSYSQRYTKLIG